MGLRVRPYFVNRLWKRCTAFVGASFARDIGRTVASKARADSDIAPNVASTARSYGRERKKRSRAQLAPTEEKEKTVVEWIRDTEAKTAKATMS